MKKITTVLAAALLLPTVATAAQPQFNRESYIAHQVADENPLSINIAPGVLTEIANFTVAPVDPSMIIERNPQAISEPSLIRNGESYANFITTVANNTLVLSVGNPITASGEYSILIPEGYLLLNGTPNGEITFSGYTIEKKNIPQEIIVTPMAGTEINSLETATVMWRGYESVFINQDNMDYDATKIYFEFNGEQIPSIANIEATDEYTIYTFSPKDRISGEGRLRLVIPKDQIQINGKNPSRDVTYYWNMALEQGGDLNITPAPGTVKEIGDFVINFPEETTTIARGNGAIYDICLYRYDEESDDYSMLASYNAKISKTEKKITLSCGETFTTKGKYKLNIPNAFFIVDGKVIPAQNFIFEVDGTGAVAGIESENNLFNIYDINGKVVILKANQEDVRNLENGLYIINGIKVLVNK